MWRKNPFVENRMRNNHLAKGENSDRKGWEGHNIEDMSKIGDLRIRQEVKADKVKKKKNGGDDGKVKDSGYRSARFVADAQ